MSDFIVAPRWKRAVAAIFDSFIFGGAFLVLFFFFNGIIGTEALRDIPEYKIKAGLSVISFFLYFSINGVLLFKKGQTIGKSLVGIRIVTIDNGHADFLTIFLRRYGFYWGIGVIPKIGMVLGIANILLIFLKGNRTGHDFVAGTMVIES